MCFDFDNYVNIALDLRNQYSFKFNTYFVMKIKFL